MRIYRLSDLGFSILNQAKQFFCFCFLVDLPAIVTSADRNLTTIICIKCPFGSNGIIFCRQFTDIRFYLIFVKCVKTIFVCCQPVFNYFFIYCLCSVIKIIGNDYVCKFIYQFTVPDQSLIILVDCRFFVTAICFQIDRGSSCDKGIYDILAGFFCLQGISLFFRNNLKFIVFLFDMSI